MKELGIGDTFRIRKDLLPRNSYDEVPFVRDMEYLKGQLLTIKDTEIHNHNGKRIKVYFIEDAWTISPSMIEWNKSITKEEILEVL